jgi:hypothetical protein
VTLPPLDPDYLISEHDPAQLHEYATGLLHHLRAIREGKPANGYGVGKIKAAADWLLEQYAEAKTTAPVEAVALWCELCSTKPTPRARTGAPVQERLLPAYIEAYLFDAAEPEAPTLYSVAKHVRATSKSDWSQEAAEAAIRSWRKRRHYRDQVRLNRRTKG